VNGNTTHVNFINISKRGSGMVRRLVREGFEFSSGNTVYVQDLVGMRWKKIEEG
jgi:hypothetical protein